MDTEVSVDGTPDAHPEAVTLVYRVVQESVRNVLRHAAATSLSVSVREEAPSIVATVTDDGCGFSSVDGAADGHLGLRLLADLTSDAGAAFSVDSTPGAGTTVRLEVPT